MILGLNGSFANNEIEVSSAEKGTTAYIRAVLAFTTAATSSEIDVGITS